MKPEFIQLVAAEGFVGHSPGDEGATNEDQDRDPRRALARVRERAAGQGSRRRSRPWARANAGAAGDSGFGVLAEIKVELFIQGIYELEHRNGAEHDVRFDPGSGRVIRLTEPNEFGASDNLEAYLQRFAWANELFDDDILIEGWLRYPNENGPRIVTTQPWYRVDPQRPEPGLAEIDAYMWAKGFLKCYEGAWLHAQREIAASDAFSKNFVLDVAGFTHAIDVILLKPTSSQLEILGNLARKQPQA
ncbi:MAG: hypothetical protein ACI8UO_000928 [Verrucomicrobiales bacterium]